MLGGLEQPYGLWLRVTTHVREREIFITSFPAISGLIRCVEDPF